MRALLLGDSHLANVGQRRLGLLERELAKNEQLYTGRGVSEGAKSFDGDFAVVVKVSGHLGPLINR